MKIYTDGACSSKNNLGGWAFVIIPNNTTNPLIFSGKKENTTNNQMELQAMLEALKYLDNNKIGEEVFIYTDSAYIANCFKDKWYIKWMSNNWITSSKTPVKNRELWENILNIYLKTKNVKIEYVKGHSDNYYNNLADKVAVQARSN